jgi:hypothetical protein
MFVHEAASNVVLLAHNGVGYIGSSAPFDVLTDPDADQDGLPDDWEREFFGSLDDPQGGPHNDADQDGLTNLDEYIAGTNPRDPASALTITAIEIQNSDLFISFSSVNGRRYQLERAEFLGAPWAALGDPVPGNGATLTVTHSNGVSSGAGFYRVKVLPDGQ